MSDLDSELQKILGAQQAAAAQAQAGLDELAGLLIRFRVALIFGGFREEVATDMARDYFNSLLDQVSGTAPNPED